MTHVPETGDREKWSQFMVQVSGTCVVGITHGIVHLCSIVVDVQCFHIFLIRNSNAVIFIFDI